MTPDVSANEETVRKFIEGNGYEVVTLRDRSRSVVPMDTTEALAALDRLVAERDRLQEIEKAARAYRRRSVAHPLTEDRGLLRPANEAASALDDALAALVPPAEGEKA